jgi:hypothetical protein
VDGVTFTRALARRMQEDIFGPLRHRPDDNVTYSSH